MRLIVIAAFAIGCGHVVRGRANAAGHAGRQARKAKTPKPKVGRQRDGLEVLSERDADRGDAHDEHRADPRRQERGDVALASGDARRTVAPTPRTGRFRSS